MTKIILSLAALVSLAACAPAPGVVTNADGWIVPDVPNVTRCVNDGDITMCDDTVTGQRYVNGVRVNR